MIVKVEGSSGIANLRALQDPNALIEEDLWPAPDATDTGNSTFTRPTLPTTP